MSITLPDPEAGPTVRRLLLGYHMRRLRIEAGLSRADAADRLRGSESKMSRVERGQVGVKQRDVVDLLDLYDFEAPQQRKLFIEMASGTTRPGWWKQFHEALPDWFQSYVGLEEAASLIRTYESQFVPGLLQTEEYARTVIAAGRQDGKVEERVELRMQRQKRFARQEDKAKLWAVVDEAAARRPVGKPDVMRKQWQRLLDLVESSNIILQIIPFAAGAHAAEATSFTILRYPYEHLHDVVYLEHLTGKVLLETSDHTEVYAKAITNLSVAADSPEATKDRLRSMIKDLEA